ncbi:MAG: shikimate dehydrogenase [Lachnospiraceae bacterium]|nr:shikimate dehydrogenase [Lachnospiraceae bacterium]
MQKYYLVGSPVSHSLSPAMHNLAFQTLGIDAAYGLCEANISELPNAIRKLKAENASGWNVTMPDKQAMCELCDVLSPEAAISRSVNTIKNIDGKLYGYTTDGAGFLRAAKENGFSEGMRNTVLLGTGGAAVSILIACAMNGAEKITVFYNRESSAQKIIPVIERLQHYLSTGNLSENASTPDAQELHLPEITLASLHDADTLNSCIRQAGLLVNATNVGMAGSHNENASPLADASCLTAGTDVFDAIYNPRKTVLLSQAEAAGLKTVNGLPMLLYQGAESFRIWTGCEMPTEQIRKSIFV